MLFSFDFIYEFITHDGNAISFNLGIFAKKRLQKLLLAFIVIWIFIIGNLGSLAHVLGIVNRVWSFGTGYWPVQGV